ncbi:hypothetical protein [Paramaledivibacter caminithermalis]|jgi:hypothetical protein|uniref:hypothetical protein n=1 Tax=Paramaledivibacter caminithermalis TaxID=191027 RepID=UPI000A61ECFA|nr:hypothetical protein [Paramaledivibacter caminithermalis]
MPIISINPRNSSDLPQPDLNEIGVPLCPNDSSIPMVYDSITREKERTNKIKYICPRAKKTKFNRKTTYILSCDNPCTNSKL